MYGASLHCSLTDLTELLLSHFSLKLRLVSSTIDATAEASLYLVLSELRGVYRHHDVDKRRVRVSSSDIAEKGWFFFFFFLCVLSSLLFLQYPTLNAHTCTYQTRPRTSPIWRLFPETIGRAADYGCSNYALLFVTNLFSLCLFLSKSAVFPEHPLADHVMVDRAIASRLPFWASRASHCAHC